MKSVKIITALLIAHMLAGCTTEDSDKVATDKIYLDSEFVVKSNNMAKVQVSLRKRHSLGSSIVLTGGDKIYMTFNGQQIALKKDESLLEVDYEGSIDTQGKAGMIDFRFERGNGEQLQAQVELPQAFQVMTPKGGDTFNEGTHRIEVTWSNSRANQMMEMHGELACTTTEIDLDREIDHENETWRVSDDASEYLQLSLLINNLKAEVRLEKETIITSEPCSLDIDLTRENIESLSSVFASGSRMVARHYREVKGMKVWVD